jgi:2-oxoglutarate dehydrogenase E2 component (dihydrolipoamide succinyltransferase)
MSIDIIVPALGESVTSAIVARWSKAVGDAVAADEPIVELETDKVTLEVNAPAAGTLTDISAPEGSEVEVGATLGRIGEGPVTAPTAAKAAPAATAAAPAATPAPVTEAPLAPAVRKLVEEHGLKPESIHASGKDGRLTKGDVLAFLERRPEASAAPTPPPPAAAPPQPAAPRPAGAREERVRLSRLRQMVAARLKAVQNTAAILTTFNEIDMTAANAIREHYRERFEKRHGVRLGIMSLFVKACIEALKEFPAVNAEIDGDDLVYKNHYDIAIAVASPQGLVVPVIRDADRLTIADIEAAIADFGKRARDGKLTVDEMQGGTFTITNGGVFGSLMSTPILNPPQAGILGMHKVQQRPMVMADGSIQARPMMYVALSYDHRIIDGREAVSFLVRVKDCVEDPQRILIGA